MAERLRALFVEVEEPFFSGWTLWFDMRKYRQLLLLVRSLLNGALPDLPENNGSCRSWDCRPSIDESNLSSPLWLRD